VDGDPSSRRPARVGAGGKGIVNRLRGGQAVVSERPKPGAREGVAGRGSSIDGRHSRPSLRHARSRGRVGVGLGDSWEVLERASVTGLTGGGDRGVRGSVRTHRDGKTTPTAMAHEGNRATRRSESPAVQAGDLPSYAERASVRTAAGTNEARVLVRRREMAEIGPTHRASRRPASRQASRRRGAGQGALRNTC